MTEKIIIEKFSNNKIALVNNDDETLTYQELLNKSLEMASFLETQNVKSIIFYGHKDFYMLIGFIACLLSKRTYVPIDISVPKKRVQNIITQIKTSIMITNYPCDVNIKKFNPNKFTLNGNKFIINNKIAYIIFTSGTTGEPKGVPISYNNLFNFITWISNQSILKKYKKLNVLNQANFNFDLSIADIFYSFFNGHTLYVHNYNLFDNLNEIFSFIKKAKIDFMVATPSFIKVLLLDKKFNYFYLKNLKCIYFCGEILEPKTVERIWLRFPKIKIINAYGPTEATSAISMANITKKMLKEDLPIGEMNYLASNIYLKNDEIVIKGPSVFENYLNDKNKVKEYYTGDLGFIKNNYLYYKGRKDNQIKYKGYRIEIEDITKNILKIDGVLETIVIPIYKSNTVVNLKALVVTENNINVNIKEKLKELLPLYMIPKIIKIVSKIPLNENGKYNQKEIKND